MTDNKSLYTDLTDSQTALNSKYSEYTVAYLSYITCLNNNVSNGKYPSSSVTRNSGNGPNATQYESYMCDASFNIFHNKQADMLNNILDVSGKIAAINSSSLPGYDNSKTAADIKSEHATLVNTRSDLDLKLQQLYNLQNTAPNTYQTQLDSTVYSGILWTVLATTLIYYVFTKL